MTNPIRIKNEELLDEFFRKLPGESYDALDKAMSDTANMIQTDAMRNVADRYNKSGRGKDGGALDTGRLNMGFRGVDDEPMRKVVGNNVSYAAHMEYGTGPAIGRPKYMPPTEADSKLAYWSVKKGYDAGGVAQLIYNRGTKPRRYLGRAFHEKKQQVPFQFAKMLAKEIENSIGKKVAVKKR